MVISDGVDYSFFCLGMFAFQYIIWGIFYKRLNKTTLNTKDSFNETYFDVT
jgi:hypothetical protein